MTYFYYDNFILINYSGIFQACKKSSKGPAFISLLFVLLVLTPMIRADSVEDQKTSNSFRKCIELCLKPAPSLKLEFAAKCPLLNATQEWYVFLQLKAYRAVRKEENDSGIA